MNWNQDCAYDEAQKRRFHATARARLRQLADALSLPAGSYDLRSNKAGIAVSGEITLHHDCVYVQVSQSSLGHDPGILIRTCASRRDYRGGHNNFASLSFLDDVLRLAEAVRAVAPGVRGRR